MGFRKINRRSSRRIELKELLDSFIDSGVNNIKLYIPGIVSAEGRYTASVFSSRTAMQGTSRFPEDTQWYNRRLKHVLTLPYSEQDQAVNQVLLDKYKKEKNLPIFTAGFALINLPSILLTDFSTLSLFSLAIGLGVGRGLDRRIRERLYEDPWTDEETLKASSDYNLELFELRNPKEI